MHASVSQAKNIDEVEERLPYPVFMPEEWFESNGVEDPRLVAIDDRVFMLYAGKALDKGCEYCKDGFEIKQSINDKPIERCPKCRAAVKKLPTTFTFQMK